MRNNEIDYYGTDADYIHVKFGDLRKCYNFTEDFQKKFPRFSEEFSKYWMCEKSIFSNPLEIVNYIIFYNIPVYAYFNFTDEPATWQEVQEWLLKNYQGARELYKTEHDKETNKFYYISLDNQKVEF